MKEEFYVMNKSLEEYFMDFIVPNVRKGELKDSRKIDSIHSLREHVGLTMLSYFLSKLNKGDYVPAINNSNYDDGVIADRKRKIFFPVEQVYVYESIWDNKALDGVKDALKKKHRKGVGYAQNNWLLIFCNANGNFNPDWIKSLLRITEFESVILFGPAGDEEFNYIFYLVKDGKRLLKSPFKLSISSTGKATLKNLHTKIR